ncbi:hypothetical protein BFL38_00730 [Brachyspira hampsonii]|uniref:Adenylyltransferase SoFic-like C-terminal domain-containing protein n=1 Tax=Brachyspira hampsonii TaxID=1287055 RepID=A0A1E5NAE1_9SPIR|nr:hypothetical protein [Brachyspira hampsonii]OEJ13136.1 hypothetical protein BFL38_00730 [Brachyspira hampsonii]
MRNKFSIEVFDNIGVLKELSKTWHAYYDFRMSCISLKNSEYLLSILSLILNPANHYEYKDMGMISYNILEEYHSKHKEFMILKEFSEKEYNSSVLSNIASRFEDKVIIIDKSYDEDLKYIDSLDLDPLLKLLVYQKVSYEYVREYSSSFIICRIVFNIYSYKLKLLDTPILYPYQFFEATISDNSSNEESIIRYLKFLRGICLYAVDTISFVQNDLMRLKSRLLLNKNFKKLADSNVFYIIFITPYVRIVDLMDMFNWKRDKAARLLSKLRDEDLFAEVRIKKEKIFVNKYIIGLFESGEALKPDEFLMKFI